MEKKRFRHHISILFEEICAVIGAFLIVITTQMADVIGKVASMGRINREVLFVICIILGIFVVILIWRYRVWSKTWITIDEEAIIIERDTILKKRNTIGYQNISNVNTVQNLLEMLLGTCKVKLDTNSLSTANKTDVVIVLKKQPGEELKKQLVRKMNAVQSGQSESLEEVVQEEEIGYVVESSFKDIFLHGIYSLNVFVVIIFVSGIAGVVSTLKDTMTSGDYALNTGAMIATIATFVVLIYSSFVSLAKGFISMYGFKSTRIGERLYLKYGLFKKVEYAIPVDKINGILIHQTFIARLLHKYTVELINVGMGDDEKQAVNFIFYTTKEHLMQSMKVLLPEYSDAFDWKIEKQPTGFWIVKLIRFAIASLVLFVGGYSVFSILADIPYQSYYPYAVIAFITLVEIFNILSYRTKGSQMGAHYFIVVDGFIGRRYTIMPYSKIQYVQYHENFVTKRLSM
ncbi:MAG: PH domain-containing protein, partial [Clostridium sp.]|nr:PH domain-containing protein [Clostridium sp.]